MFDLVVRGHDISLEGADIEELSNKIKDYGIKNVQFALSKSLHNYENQFLTPSLGTKIKNIFREKDIQISVLSCYSNLIHPDLRKREKILRNFENYLFHARFFQASMVASETGSVVPGLGYSIGNFTDECFDDMVQVIRRLVISAERFGALIGIEAGLNHPLYSNDRIKELLNRISSEFLGIIYDPTNLIDYTNYHYIAELVEDAFNSFSNKIVCVHLKDFVVLDGEIFPVALGEGILPYDKILDTIKRYNPYCYIVLEETKDRKIKNAVQLIEHLK